MENYHKFNRKILTSVGVNFKESGEESKYEWPLQIFTLFVVFVTTFQNFMYLAMSENFELMMAAAVAVAMYDLQGCFKFLAIIWNLDKIKKIQKTLDELTKSLTKEQITENAAEFGRFRKITTFLVANNLFSCWIFNLMPMLVLIFFMFAKGIMVQHLPYAFWYPFNKTEHYFPVYFYEVYTGHFLTAVPPLIDGLMMLMTGQLVVLFKCLGENLIGIINSYEASKKSATAQKFNEIIDLHNQLLDISEELFHVYEIPLLVNVLAQTLTTCFIAFIISVR